MTTARDIAREPERGALATVLSIVVAALLLGVAGGFLTGRLTETEPGLTATEPLEAASPSVPFTPYSADVAYPSWQPDLDYRHTRIGSGQFAWQYDVPKGWDRTRIGETEFLWGTPGHPLGSYGFRIETVGGQHSTTEGMVARKLAELRTSVADVRVLSQTSDTLAITYRSLPENWLRYNTFRWFPGPGGDTAAIEISVNGRGIDQDGMNDLLEKVSASLGPA